MRPKITMEIGQATYDELLTLSETIGYPPEAALSYAVRLVNACIREGLLKIKALMIPLWEDISHKIIKNTDTDSEVMCMKNKISICILVVLGILLTVWVLESIDNRISQKQNNEDTQIQIAETKEVSKVVISYEYIVKNDNGMITVYKNYGTDKFFDTGVYYNELPEDIKSKINNGFGFETESELYDFLESYSS